MLAGAAARVFDSGAAGAESWVTSPAAGAAGFEPREGAEDLPRKNTIITRAAPPTAIKIFFLFLNISFILYLTVNLFLGTKARHSAQHSRRRNFEPPTTRCWIM